MKLGTTGFKGCYERKPPIFLGGPGCSGFTATPRAAAAFLGPGSLGGIESLDAQIQQYVSRFPDRQNSEVPRSHVSSVGVRKSRLSFVAHWPGRSHPTPEAYDSGRRPTLQPGLRFRGATKEDPVQNP